MSRRDQIRMTPEEVDAFLAGRHTLAVATLGPDGHPHLVAMWYGFLDGDPAFWTYGKSQKVVNVRRDPRITGMIEDGLSYDQLRGVELVGTAEVVEDPAQVVAVGANIHERYTGPGTDGVLPVIEQMARKRVVVRIHVERIVSWDHRKLGGTY